jgi:hypothetical protein
LFVVNNVGKFSSLLVSPLHMLEMLLSVRIMTLLVLFHISFVIGFVVTLWALEVLDSVFNVNSDVTLQMTHVVRRVVTVEAVELLPSARVVLGLHVCLQTALAVCLVVALWTLQVLHACRIVDLQMGFKAAFYIC